MAFVCGPKALLRQVEEVGDRCGVPVHEELEGGLETDGREVELGVRALQVRMPSARNPTLHLPPGRRAPAPRTKAKRALVPGCAHQELEVLVAPPNLMIIVPRKDDVHVEPVQATHLRRVCRVASSN